MKKNKQKIKFYHLDSEGNYIEEVKQYNNNTPKEMPHLVVAQVEDENKKINDDDKYQLNEKSIRLEELLHQNPFLYSIKNNSMPEITSIEDFYIKYKKKEYTFKEVLRGNKFKKFKRNYIIKRSLNHWYKCADEDQQEIMFRGREEIKNSKYESPNKVSFITFILYIFTLLVCIVLIQNFIPIIPPLEGLPLTLFPFVIVLIFLGIMLGCLQRMKIHNYEENLSENKKLYNRYKKELTKEFKVKSNKTRKYYIKELNRKKFRKDPLAIEKTAISSEKLEYIDQLSTQMNKDSMRAVFNNRNVNLLYRFPTILSFVLVIMTVGYTIGMLIYSFIQN